jgi:hypothetical protein
MARHECIAVYIVASQRNGTLYIGVTSDLPRRAYEHREGLIDGFTKKYGCKLLVWFEQYDLLYGRDRTGKEAQGLQARLEARSHREVQPPVA